MSDGTQQQTADSVGRSVSRQRLWQIRMVSEGRCQQCGKPRVTRLHCRLCADKAVRFAAPHIAKWEAADPRRRKALSLLNRAVKRGVITRPIVCTRCGALDPKINGHHHDYDKPLDVTWLCYRCHAAVERRGAKDSLS